MPHTYKRKPGARAYCDYTEEAIENALRDIPRLGLNGAHRAHGIPYGMLYNKYHGKHPNMENNYGMLRFSAFDLISFHHLSSKHNLTKIFSSWYSFFYQSLLFFPF